MQELKFLADGLSDLQENPEDVFSRANVENVTLLQSFNDDPSEDDFDEMDGDQIVCDPSTAWHKVDNWPSEYIDPALPLPLPQPVNPVFIELMQDARTGNGKLGKEIYTIMKSGKVKLSYQQWNEIWTTYDTAKKSASSNRRRKVFKSPPPYKPLVITAMPAPTPAPPPDFTRPTPMITPKRTRFELRQNARRLARWAKHPNIQNGVFCTHCTKDACPKGCFGFVPKFIPSMMRISTRPAPQGLKIEIEG